MWLSAWVMNVKVHYCVGLKNTSCVYSPLSRWAHEQQTQAPSKQTAQTPLRVTELWQTQLTLVMHPLPTASMLSASKPCFRFTLTAPVFSSRFSNVTTTYWKVSQISILIYTCKLLKKFILDTRSVSKHLKINSDLRLKIVRFKVTLFIKFQLQDSHNVRYCM